MYIMQIGTSYTLKAFVAIVCILQHAGTDMQVNSLCGLAVVYDLQAALLFLFNECVAESGSCDVRDIFKI